MFGNGTAEISSLV